MQQFIDLLERASDESRPVRRAIVVGNAGWRLSGASFVDVMLNGARRRVIYRDGEEVPLIGTTVQVIKMDSGIAAGYLAFPLTPTSPVIDCAYEFFFRVNGRLTEPPTELPSDGSMGNKTVTATYIISSDCRNVHAYLYSWGSVDGTPGSYVLVDSDHHGPHDGPFTDVVEAVVAGPPTYFFYYIVFLVTNQPGNLPDPPP